jgi:NitT/TauT family transport system substrate-binding protein
MVHASRGFHSIEDVFTHPGTLAMEVQLPYGKFLQQKYGFEKVKRVPYSGGIANFLADRNFSQQCFIFSEPLTAKKAGADPQTFLIADAGYNPYTGVIITRGETERNNADLAKRMFQSLQDGWRSYLDDPKPANDVMGKLNRTMDAATFAAAAEAQKNLIETDESKKTGLGAMTRERWETLVKQLTDLKVVDQPPPAAECYVDVSK